MDALSDAVFVEIGSSEEQWGRADAADVWADVLTRYASRNFIFASEVRVLRNPASPVRSPRGMVFRAWTDVMTMQTICEKTLLGHPPLRK